MYAIRSYYELRLRRLSPLFVPVRWHALRDFARDISALKKNPLTDAGGPAGRKEMGTFGGFVYRVLSGAGLLADSLRTVQADGLFVIT